MDSEKRVLMLGLDAADFAVVQKFMRDGRMPRLASLARRGISGPLDSPADLYAGGVWPTFYTGHPVASHGVFHNKQWRPETMQVEAPTTAWTTAVPVWETWAARGIDSLIIDVPMVLGRPRPLRGAYLGGWATHDLISRGSWPGDLWHELEKRFGAPLMPRENFGRQTDALLAELGPAMTRATGQLRDIAIALMTQRTWQFACIVFSALHRGGHYLLDRVPPASAAPTANGGDEVPAMLADLYRGLDDAVGRLIARAPADTLVIAFAVHGMRRNPGWSDLLPAILLRIDQHRSGTMPRRGTLYRLRQTIPHHWVRPVLNALPAAAGEQMVKWWSRRMFDWAHTRYFPLPMDDAGYLRINLRGREKHGIVAAGGEYEALCDDLERLVASLRDEATGGAIAAPAVRAWRDADPDAACRQLLPDLVFPWAGPAAVTTRRLVSTMLPDFRYEVPEQLPSGRSGNHNNRGWFIAAGPGVGQGRPACAHHIIDLLPTVMRYLRVETDRQLPGRVIPEVAGQ